MYTYIYIYVFVFWFLDTDKSDNQETCSATASTGENFDCTDGSSSSSLTRSSLLVDVGGEVKERSCDSLIMCIVTTLNQGLRNGGGIGDILRAPSSQVCDFSITKFVMYILISQISKYFNMS